MGIEPTTCRICSHTVISLSHNWPSQTPHRLYSRFKSYFIRGIQFIRFVISSCNYIWTHNTQQMFNILDILIGREFQIHVALNSTFSLYIHYYERQLRRGLWVRFPLKRIKYLIFSFPHPGIEAKRGVKFCHSLRNTSTIRNEVKNGA